MHENVINPPIKIRPKIYAPNDKRTFIAITLTEHAVTFSPSSSYKNMWTILLQKIAKIADLLILYLT